MPQRHTTIVFRVDGSGQIGLGHVMRSLALAEGLMSLGVRSVFICRRLDGAALEIILQRGLTAIALPEWTQKWDEASDAQATLSIARQVKAAAIVVDHYGLGMPWWKTVRTQLPLTAIDDLGRPGLGQAATLVINANAGASAAWYSGGAMTACGPRYALLGSKFTARSSDRMARLNRSEQAADSDEKQRVLITMGGADPAQVTASAVGCVLAATSEALIDVVIGPAFSNRDALVRQLSTSSRVQLHQRPADISPLMAAADLAVIAGGSTIYECALLGVPMLLIEVAENQHMGCEAMHEAGAALFLGRTDEFSQGDLTSLVDRVLTDTDLRRQMSEQGMQLVDGQGARRTAAAIMQMFDAAGGRASQEAA